MTCPSKERQRHFQRFGFFDCSSKRARLSNSTSKGFVSDINTHDNIMHTKIFIISTSVEKTAPLIPLWQEGLYSRFIRVSSSELKRCTLCQRIDARWKNRPIKVHVASAFCRVIGWIKEQKRTSHLKSGLRHAQVMNNGTQMQLVADEEPASVPHTKSRPQIKGFAEKIQQAGV